MNTPEQRKVGPSNEGRNELEQSDVPGISKDETEHIYTLLDAHDYDEIRKVLEGKRWDSPSVLSLLLTLPSLSESADDITMEIFISALEDGRVDFAETNILNFLSALLNIIPRSAEPILHALEESDIPLSEFLSDIIFRCFSLTGIDRAKRFLEWKKEFFADNPEGGLKLLKFLSREGELEFVQNILKDIDLKPNMPSAISVLLDFSFDGKYHPFLFEKLRQCGLSGSPASFLIVRGIAENGSHENRMALMELLNEEMPESFSERDIAFAEGKRDTNTLILKRNVREQMLHSGDFEDEASIDTLLDTLSAEELFFLSKARGKVSLNLLRRMSEGRFYSFDILKNGGDLHIFSPNKQEGAEQMYIVNDNPNDATDAWERAENSGASVAPLYRRSERDMETSRTYSRYSGQTLDHYVYSSLDGPEKLAPFLKNIFFQYVQIHDHLKHAKDPGGKSVEIRHNHPHGSNVTVEFIKKDFLEEKRATTGHALNTVPFSPENFTFDLAEYMARPSEYQIVVRLIDFDDAEIISKDKKESPPPE